MYARAHVEGAKSVKFWLKMKKSRGKFSFFDFFVYICNVTKSKDTL